MRCPQCHAENREGASFCRNCGAAFGAARGPSDELSGDAYFCDSCGANLTLASLSHPSAPTPGGMPAEQAAALETERKQVTVLFADITDSTRLIAGRDPEEARALLDPV